MLSTIRILITPFLCDKEEGALVIARAPVCFSPSSHPLLSGIIFSFHYRKYLNVFLYGKGI